MCWKRLLKEPALRFEEIVKLKEARFVPIADSHIVLSNAWLLEITGSLAKFIAQFWILGKRIQNVSCRRIKIERYAYLHDYSVSQNEFLKIFKSTENEKHVI